jgi:glycosyltransferase involved in cell wall biosynthesis
MSKIFILNNYSFERVGREVAAGKKPRHHLYAADALGELADEIVIVPFDETGRHIWSRVSRWWRKSKIPIPLGDLHQQVYVLKRLRKNDIIYAPCQTQTQLLTYLRRFRLLPNKIVVLAHHPPIRGRFQGFRRWLFRQELKGSAAYPALATAITEQINALVPNKSSALHWGPAISFYQHLARQRSTSTTFLAAGRTGRDFLTFAKACSATNVDAHIICLQQTYERQLQSLNLPSSIRVTTNSAENSLLYDKLVPLMAAAEVICIPLFHSNEHLAGLTSLTDALALGKAIIMTRNRFIDIDIEAEGIGIWVEVDDVKGWIAALTRLQNDEQLRKTMGERALQLAQEKWNATQFATEIKQLIIA